MQEEWWLVPIILVPLIPMLAVDLYFIIRVGKFDHDETVKYLDQAERWLGWKGPLVRALTFGIVNPRKMVDSEVQEEPDGDAIHPRVIALVGDRADRPTPRVRAHPLDSLGSSWMMMGNRIPKEPIMSHDRRQFLAAAAIAVPVALQPRLVKADDNKPSRPTRIGVSTYSFWQFKNEDYRDLEKCIDLAGEMGFDAVEILHRQMKDETPGYLAEAQAASVSKRHVAERLLDAPGLPVPTKG